MSLREVATEAARSHCDLCALNGGGDGYDPCDEDCKACSTGALRAELDRDEGVDLESELAVNAAMLARQCDLAREAETVAAAEKARWGELRAYLVERVAERKRLYKGFDAIREGIEQVLDHMDTIAPVDCVRVVVDGPFAFRHPDGSPLDNRNHFNDGDVLYLVRAKGVE